MLYESAKVAAEELHLRRTTVLHVLRGNRDHTGGYEFEYTGELTRVPVDVLESIEIQAEVVEAFRWRFENASLFAQEMTRNRVGGEKTTLKSSAIICANGCSITTPLPLTYLGGSSS